MPASGCRDLSPDAVPPPSRLDREGAPENPLDLLAEWWERAAAISALEPAYVTLATASADGVPSSRTVQLLAVEADALLFTTDQTSRKGVEMHATGRAAVSVLWRETAQSVNVTGHVVWADDAESDVRFAAEPRAVQASRTVSVQGHPIEDEEEQLRRLADLIGSDAPITRPARWRWFRLVPDAVTFWHGVPQALNQRLHYARERGTWARRAIQA